MRKVPHSVLRHTDTQTHTGSSHWLSKDVHSSETNLTSSAYCSKYLLEMQWAEEYRLFHKAARAIGSVLSLCSCSFMVDIELSIEQRSEEGKGVESFWVFLCVLVALNGHSWEIRWKGGSSEGRVFLHPAQHLPSTTTLQAHSAFPAEFSAMHLYSPPSSGMAFSMVSEQSVPVQRRERSNAC